MTEEQNLWSGPHASNLNIVHTVESTHLQTPLAASIGAQQLTYESLSVHFM
jgi:hypothetical protein